MNDILLLHWTTSCPGLCHVLLHVLSCCSSSCSVPGNAVICVTLDSRYSLRRRVSRGLRRKFVRVVAVCDAFRRLATRLGDLDEM